MGKGNSVYTNNVHFILVSEITFCEVLKWVISGGKQVCVN